MTTLIALTAGMVRLAAMMLAACLLFGTAIGAMSFATLAIGWITSLFI